MNLIKCHIENFGKLQNFDFEFTKGLNTIKEENGFGKTTFANFIKAMFYGLDTSKSEKSDRKRYMPWQGGKFGGNLEFEIGNKKYRIERFFEKKATDDTFKLYDLETNLESTDYSENIGEEIFKINKEAYERSTYIPQGQIQIQMDDSINAKLGNVLESDNDINTSEEAIKRLEEAMKIYKKTGNRGLINEKEAKLNELKRTIENNKSDETNLEIRRKKLKETIEQIKEKENSRNEKQKLLNEKIGQDRKKAKLETYNTIMKKIQENNAKNEEFQEFFKEGVPTDEELEILSAKCLEIEKYKGEMSIFNISTEEQETLQKLEAKFKNQDISIEKIDKKIVDCNEIRDVENKLQNIQSEIEKSKQKISDLDKKRKSNNKIFLIMLILAIALLITGISLIVASNNLGIMALTLGIISLIIEIFKKKDNYKIPYVQEKDNIEALQETEQNLNVKKENLELEIDNFIKTYINNYEDIIIALTEIKTEFNRYKDLTQSESNKLQKNAQTKEKVELLEDSIREYLHKYFTSIDKTFSDLVNILKLQKNELNRVLKELEEANKSKEEYEKQNNVEELKDVTSVDGLNETELQKEIDSLSIQIDSLNDEKNQNKNQIELLENKVDENSELEEEKDSLEEEIKALKEKYSVLDQTKKYMEKAKERFSSHYLKGMVQGFEENLNLLDDKNLDTNVDINLGVQIDSNGSKREIKYFSAGYKDLIYICMRFSLVKVLFENELPFVILDDPFVNLDDEKTEKAIELLKKFSEKYQIIYLICNKSRM